MLAISSGFRQELNKDNRNYTVTVSMTLADGTALTLNNSNIVEGGVSFSEGTSSDSSFDIGSAIIGESSITINNIYGDYDEYDFFNATYYLNFGLTVNGTLESVRKGYYTVDSASYDASTITLVGLDNMWKFDDDFSDITVTYPTTAQALVLAICSHCGVTLNNSQFKNYTTVIPAPIEELADVNCREVLQYIAQMCACFCRINPNGKLELTWYAVPSVGDDADGGYFDDDSPYSSGDDADGGTFSPWNTGAVLDGGTFAGWTETAYLAQLSSVNVATDDTLITGIRVLNEDDETGYDYTYGTTDYCLVIEDNPFITQSNYTAIATQIGSSLVGMSFRTFDCSNLNNIAYQAGDYCQIKVGGTIFKSFITNLTFTIGDFENFSCGAESVTKNKTVRYSKEVATAIQKAKADAKEQISDYDLVVQQLNSLAVNAMGMFTAKVETASGGVIVYQSDHPITKDSNGNAVFTRYSKVWKITGSGFFITTSSGTSDSSSTWIAGWDSDNHVVVNTLSAIGISFDWAKGGTLTLGGASNVNGTLLMLDASGNEFGHWKNIEFNIGGSVGLNATASSITIGGSGGLSVTSSRISLGGSSGFVATSSGITIGSTDGYHASFSGSSLILQYGSSNLSKLTLNSNSINIGNQLTISSSQIKIGSQMVITSSSITIGSTYSSPMVLTSSGITIGSKLEITNSSIAIGDSSWARITMSGSSIIIGNGWSSGSITITSTGITMGNSSSTIVIGGGIYGNGITISSSSIVIGGTLENLTISSNGIKCSSNATLTFDASYSTKITASSIELGNFKATANTFKCGGSYSGYMEMDSSGNLTMNCTLKHTGSYIGFFSHSTSSKQTCTTVSSSASLSDVISKLNELINDLGQYGLIGT